MAKNKKKKKKSVRNLLQQAAIHKSGSGKHKDKRLKRQNRNSWKKLLKLSEENSD